MIKSENCWVWPFSGSRTALKTNLKWWFAISEKLNTNKSCTYTCVYINLKSNFTSKPVLPKPFLLCSTNFQLQKFLKLFFFSSLITISTTLDTFKFHQSYHFLQSYFQPKLNLSFVVENQSSPMPFHIQTGPTLVFYRNPTLIITL